MRADEVVNKFDMYSRFDRYANNIMLRCAVGGVPGRPSNPFGYGPVR